MRLKTQEDFDRWLSEGGPPGATILPGAKEPEDPRGPLEEVGSALGAGAASTMESIGGTMEMAGIPGGATTREYYRDLGESPSLRRPAYLAEGTVVEHPERLLDWRWWVRSLGENTPTMAAMMLPGLGAMRAARLAGWGEKAIRTVSLAGAFGGAATVEAGAAYSEAKDEMIREGWDPVTTEQTATLEGITIGIANGILEILPFDTLFLKSTGAHRIIKKIVRQALTEGGTEMAQEAVSIYVESLGHKPEQGFRENVGRIVESGIIGTVLGGGVGGVFAQGEGTEDQKIRGEEDQRVREGRKDKESRQPMASSTHGTGDIATAGARDREELEKDEKRRAAAARGRAETMLDEISREDEAARADLEALRAEEGEKTEDQRVREEFTTAEAMAAREEAADDAAKEGRVARVRGEEEPDHGETAAPGRTLQDREGSEREIEAGRGREGGEEERIETTPTPTETPSTPLGKETEAPTTKPPAPLGKEQGVPTEGIEGGEAEKTEDQIKPQAHKYSSTQVNLPETEAKPVLDFGKKIPDEELYIDPEDPDSGRVESPHITVKYGLHTVDPEDLKPILEGQGPIKATLGKVSVFENDEADVVKVDIDGPELHALNKLISEKIEVTDTHPVYRPHLTIAYVKKGEGKKYIGDSTFEGKEITFNSVVFSGKDGKEQVLELRKGKPRGVATITGKRTGGEARGERLEAGKEKAMSKAETLLDSLNDIEKFALSKMMEEKGIDKIDIVPIVMKSGRDGWTVRQVHKDGTILDHPTNVDVKELQNIVKGWLYQKSDTKKPDSLRWVDFAKGKEFLEEHEVEVEKQKEQKTEYEKEQYIRRDFKKRTSELSALEYRKKKGLKVSNEIYKKAKDAAERATQRFNDFYRTGPTPEVKKATEKPKKKGVETITGKRTGGEARGERLEAGKEKATKAKESWEMMASEYETMFRDLEDPEVKAREKQWKALQSIVKKNEKIGRREGLITLKQWRSFAEKYGDPDPVTDDLFHFFDDPAGTRGKIVKKTVSTQHRQHRASVKAQAAKDASVIPDAVKAEYPDLFKGKAVTEPEKAPAKVPEQATPAKGGEDISPNRIAERYVEIANVADKHMPFAVAMKNAKGLLDAINNGIWTDLLDPSNKISRTVFEEFTGQKLPKTLKGTKELIEERKPTEPPAPEAEGRAGETMPAVRPQAAGIPPRRDPTEGGEPGEVVVGEETKLAVSRGDAVELNEKGIVERVKVDRTLIKEDEDWIAGKEKGDRAAADRFADKFWADKKTEKLKEQLDSPGNTVFIAQPSTTRMNVHPLSLAEKLAKDLGGEYVRGDDYYTAAHEEASKDIPKYKRAFYPRDYEPRNLEELKGITEGKEVVVVDDIFTSGGSVAAFIRTLNGAGIDVKTVVGYMGDARLKVDRATQTALGKALKNAGIKDIRAKDLAGLLTRTEARDIIRTINNAGTENARQKITRDLQGLLDRGAQGDVRSDQHRRQPERGTPREDSRHGRLAEGVQAHPAVPGETALSAYPLAVQGEQPSQLSPKQIKNIVKIARKVREWLKAAGLPAEVIARIDVELKAIIDISGKDVSKTTEQWAEQGISLDTILGATTFRNYRGLLELALSVQSLGELERTTYHEAFHVAARWILPEADYAKLIKYFKTEEKAADAFSSFVAGRKVSPIGGHPGPIRAILLKLRRLLKIIRNGLNGMGFTRPEDIFGKIAVDAYRPHFGQAEGTGVSLQALTDLKRQGNFKAWFDESKVVDEKGDPLVVYHGTPAKFNVFKKYGIRDRGFYSSGYFLTKDPVYAKLYTTSIKTGKLTKSGRVMALYASIENPFDFDNVTGKDFDKLWVATDQIRKNKGLEPNSKERYGSYKDAFLNAKGSILSTPAYERATLGLTSRETLELAGYDGAFANNKQEIVAFYPNQIKSIFNTGTWSPETGDIRLAVKQAEGTGVSLQQAYAPQAWLNVAKQPVGEEVSRELAENRSFVNKIFEMKDLALNRVKTEVAKLQEEVQGMAGQPSRRKFVLGFAHNRELKRSMASDQLDRAMMVWRDLQNKPEKEQEFRDWAEGQLEDQKTPARDKIKIKGQLKLLNQAVNLKDEQKKFTEKMGGLFEAAHAVAKQAKIIKSHMDNYVRRIWTLPEGKEEDFKSSGSGYGFKTYTTAAKQRTLDTILDGWMNGYELKVQGITNSYGQYMEDLAGIMANKAFVQRGVATMGLDGNSMFSATEHEGYGQLKASGFQVWRWAGKAVAEADLPDQEALAITAYGRKFFATPPERIPERWAVYKDNADQRAARLFDSEKEANEWAKDQGYDRIERRPPEDVSEFFEKAPLYAPRPIAEMINKMTASGDMFGEVPVLKGLLRLNASMKAWVLLSSLFHHMAGSRSWIFGVHHGWKGWNPVSAYKAGLDKIRERHALVELGVKNGLTLGDLQDWSERALGEQKGFAERLVNYFGLEKAGKVIEYGRFNRERFTDSLFKKFFAGLKAEAFVMEYGHELQKANEKYTKGVIKAPPDTGKIAEKVARLINADFGGLHLGRMGRNPSLQKWFRILLLAPDWCCDFQTRAMTKAGWKYHHELETNDEIMAFDPETQKLKWSKLKDKYVNKNYAGKMIRIKNFSRSVMLTPDHTCYVYNSTTKRNDIVKAKDLQTNHQIPRCADFDFPEKETYTDYFVKLCGWLVTDGYVKKSYNKLADGSTKEYRYGRITQSKPRTVEMLKNLGITYHVDDTNCDHDKFKANYKKHVFNIPNGLFQKMQDIGLEDGLNWEFLSKLTKRQIKLLDDTMMLGCGTGQNRFSGKEKIVFYMTLIRTMQGLPSTFYQQEENCWRTRWITRGKGISCWGHHDNKDEVDYSGTIWCPSVDTGFWLAERKGLIFITGNTESNFRTVSGWIPGLNDKISRFMGDVPGPKGMEKIYRKFWGRVVFRIAVSTVLAQMLLNGWDETEEFINEQMLSNRFNKKRWTEVDVTKLYNMLGIDTEGRRKTFSIGGHFFDPLKLMDPWRLIKGKGSPVVRVAGAFVSGSDWADRPFTGAAELLTTGKTIKKSTHLPKEGAITRAPATIVNQVVNMQPIQIGHFIQYLQGEEDGLTALMQSAGAQTHTAWPPRLETPILEAEGKKADPAFDMIEKMLKAGDLSMGPPSRYMTVGGITQRMTRGQYAKYLNDSSSIVRRKLERRMKADNWEQFSPEKRAKIIRKVILNARKRVRSRIKKSTARGMEEAA